MTPGGKNGPKYAREGPPTIQAARRPGVDKSCYGKRATRSRSRPSHCKIHGGALRAGVVFSGIGLVASEEHPRGSQQGGELADNSLTHLVRDAIRHSGCRRSTSPSSASERGRVGWQTSE